jgi:hypothetical protein
VWTETPDLQDFANELHTLRNREELVTVLKNRALDRGFKVQLPYGIKNYTFYVSCAHYRSPRPNCDEPPEPVLEKTKGGKKQRQCPFSLIIKKHPIGPEGMPHLHPAFNFNPEDPSDNLALSQGMGIGVYYLAKFRGLHNHALEMNLILGEHAQQGLSDDPQDVSARRQRYTHQDKRNHQEKAVMGHFEGLARE